MLAPFKEKKNFESVSFVICFLVIYFLAALLFHSFTSRYKCVIAVMTVVLILF